MPKYNHKSPKKHQINPEKNTRQPKIFNPIHVPTISNIMQPLFPCQNITKKTPKKIKSTKKNHQTTKK